MSVKRHLAAAAVAVVAVAASAAGASAATISCANGCSTIFYKAEVGETNTPTFTNAHDGATCRPATCFRNGIDSGLVSIPGYYGEFISDPTATLVGTAGCVNDNGDPHVVWCHSTFNRPGTIALSLNDGNDSFTDASDAGWSLTGTAGSGDDTITHVVPTTFTGTVNVNLAGGTDTIQSTGGAETVLGGSGGDTINLSDFTSVSVMGEGSSDAITLTNARLGGAGPYTVDAGVGNDNIKTIDGVSETIACGDGRDTFTVEAIDVVGADCP